MFGLVLVFGVCFSVCYSSHVSMRENLTEEIQMAPGYTKNCREILT